MDGVLARPVRRVDAGRPGGHRLHLALDRRAHHLGAPGPRARGPLRLRRAELGRPGTRCRCSSSSTSTSSWSGPTWPCCSAARSRPSSSWSSPSTAGWPTGATPYALRADWSTWSTAATRGYERIAREHPEWLDGRTTRRRPGPDGPRPRHHRLRQQPDRRPGGRVRRPAERRQRAALDHRRAVSVAPAIQSWELELP